MIEVVREGPKRTQTGRGGQGRTRNKKETSKGQSIPHSYTEVVGERGRGRYSTVPWARMNQFKIFRCKVQGNKTQLNWDRTFPGSCDVLNSSNGANLIRILIGPSSRGRRWLEGGGWWSVPAWKLFFSELLNFPHARRKTSCASLTPQCSPHSSSSYQVSIIQPPSGLLLRVKVCFQKLPRWDIWSASLCLPHHHTTLSTSSSRSRRI